MTLWLATRLPDGNGLMDRQYDHLGQSHGQRTARRIQIELADREEANRLYPGPSVMG
jgi:hypothetical protein